MLSYLTARYQKAVDDEEILFACVQEMVTAISAFLKSSDSKPREVGACNLTVKKEGCSQTPVFVGGD